MHTGFVRKRPWCSDWHIKGNWKIEALRHKAIELDQLREIVRLQQFWVMNIELRDQAAKRGDAIAFTYTHDGNVEAVCTTLQRRDSISDGTSGIIMSVELNANGIRQANALHSCIDDGIKDGQQVNQVAAKCIFSRKAHIASCGSDESNQGHSITKHLIDTAAMTECAQLCRCSIKEIQTENRRIQCSLYISLNTTHMCDNARAQAKFT